MKKIYILLLLILSAQIAHSQAWEWYNKGQGLREVQVCSDNLGFHYLAAAFTQTAAYKSSTFSTSQDGLLLIKSDANSNTIWTSVIEGDSIGLSTLASHNNLIYLSGTFRGSLHSGSTTVTSAGGDDIFMACFDQSGNIVFLKRDGSPLNELLSDMDVSSDGLIICGRFATGGSLSGYTFNSNSYYGMNSFLAQYSGADGTNIWCQEVYDSTTTFSEPSHIRWDHIGGFYMILKISGPHTFGDTTITSGGYDGQLLTHWMADGSFNWLTLGLSGYAKGTVDITTDDLGNAYLLRQLSCNHCYTKTEIWKLSPYGNTLWTREAGNYGSGYTGAQTISHKDGKLYVAGAYSQEVALPAPYRLGGKGNFLLRYNTAGTLELVRNGTWENSNGVYTAVADALGNIFLAGNSQAPVDYGDLHLNPDSDTISYVVKLNLALTETPASLVLSPTTIEHCAGSYFQVNTITSNITFVKWYLPGHEYTGGPYELAYSAPHVAYLNEGYYSGAVVYGNSTFSDSLYFPDFIHIFRYGPPQLTVSGSTISVDVPVDSLMPGTSYNWLLSGMNYSGGQTFVPSFDGTCSVLFQYYNGCLGESDTIPYSMPTAVAGLDEKPALIFPVPASETLNLQLHQPADKVLLRDAQGRILHENQAPSQQLRIDVSRFSAGVYTLEIISGKGSSIRKVVVQH
jgi:hypothetical protein